MTDAKALIREWMDLMAIGPAEAWEGKASSDLRVTLPYAPPGVAAEMLGFEAARETLSRHWDSKQSFEWRDVVTKATEDPELYVTTARSEAVMTSGQRYANSYVMLTRVRGGMIVEHAEYFNPLPIVELLGGAG
jgi:ketosteroid isomerase-like protein